MDMRDSTRAAQRICEALSDKLDGGERIRIVGITGPPGTGKSTVAGLLADLLAARGVCVAGIAPMDGFHLSNALLEQRGLADCKGAPDTFDVDGYIHLLRRIRSCDTTVLAPEYRRDVHEPVSASQEILPQGVVITEGNYLGLDTDTTRWGQVRGLIDVLVYLRTPREGLFRRLIDRHIAFGREPWAAAHWVRTVDANNIDLIEQTACRADIIVNTT